MAGNPQQGGLKMLIRRSSLSLALVMSIAVAMVIGCGSGGSDPPAASLGSASTDASGAKSESKPGVTEPVQVRAREASSNTPAQPPRAALAPEVILKTSVGNIRLRLNAEKSPLTVDNFLSNYVERGFYDGTVFHYVEKGFMVACGGYTTELEPKQTRAYVKNEAKNGLKNKRGTIAMARNPDHSDSATSQFFINLADNASLDHQSDANVDASGYCVFGEVVEGMDIVDRIADVEVADRGQFPKTPVTPVLIQSVEWIR
jgi:cyclophilin family peptidyl-prolyl cis-trans isomerase